MARKMSRALHITRLSREEVALVHIGMILTNGVHTYMTNTRITDAEAFERRYLVLLRKFPLRAGSGGVGKYRGSDDVIRDIE
jgi:hypothetical protein